MKNIGKKSPKPASWLLGLLADVAFGKRTEVTITAIEPPAGRTPCWVDGYLGEYTFEALLYPEHPNQPEIEVPRSHIAKLCVRRFADGHVVAPLDRGWKLLPSTRAVRAIVDALTAVLTLRIYGPTPEAPPAPGRSGPACEETEK